jgi:tetraacyldisaccharide 4'-kinase
MKNCARPWLLPLNPLYRAAVTFRELRLSRGWEPVQRLSWPVVSIGNLSTGGAGKTPLTIELSRLLTATGVSVDILSRGYGRKTHSATRVNPAGSAEDFGDEPLFMAQSTGFPIYVARNRYEAGLLAEQECATIKTCSMRIHLLDDGFQHRQIHRDVDILLMNRRDWNDSLLPAGNLRESLKALQRASIVAIPSDEPELNEEIRATGFTGSIWQLKRTMDIAAALRATAVSTDQPIAAFCGIAHAAPFFEGLASVGLQIKARGAFPDHHPYSNTDLQKIIENARKVGAQALFTTEKDLARLGTQRQILEDAMPVTAIGLRTEIEDTPGALNWLLEKLSGWGHHCTENSAINGKSRPATGQLFP